MRVLLMLPINRSYVIMPSLGIGYLASILKKAGHDVKILHCIKEQFDFEDFEKYIEKNSFDIIGIQIFTFDITPAIKHLKIIKRISPNTVTVLGGYHPSGDPEGVLNTFSDADFAFSSEAELALPAFIDEIRKLTPNFEQVPNLIWRKGQDIIINPLKIIEELDTIPFPEWDLMDPRTYPEAPHGGFFKSFPTAPLIITRGCPMQCTFCAGKSVTTKHVRKRSVENVLSEIVLLKERFGVNDFLIEDENFTMHKQLVTELCNKLIERDLKITWSCPSGVRLDTLDEEMLLLMERSGCHSLSVGVEFGSQRIHDITKKMLTLDKIRSKLNLFKKTGIKTTGFFMFGIPGETKEEMLQTIKFAKSLNLDRAQFNNFMPLPGSEIYRQLKEEGLKDIDHEHFFVHDVGYVPNGLTRRDMKNIQRKAYLEFYFRPKIIRGLLRQITSFKQLYRLFKRFLDGLK